MSNNPYDLSASPRSPGRPRLDGGVLGVASVRVLDSAEAKQLAALAAAGNIALFPGWHESDDAQLDVTSGQPIALGVDGEAITLDSPLSFVTRPGALVVRVARERVQRRSTPLGVDGPRPLPFTALSRLMSGRGVCVGPAGGIPGPPAGRSMAASREPVEDWLAEWIADAVPGEQPEALLRVLRTLGRWDLQAYEAVAGWSTPMLDEPMRIVAQVANHSKPWIATARSSRPSAGAGAGPPHSRVSRQSLRRPSS